MDRPMNFQPWTTVDVIFTMILILKQTSTDAKCIIKMVLKVLIWIESIDSIEEQPDYESRIS